VAATIEEGFVDVGGIGTFVRRREGDGTPTLFVHGNPSNSVDWVPFLERLSGPALAPDLPNFGRSLRPSTQLFDSSMHAYGDFVERYLEAEGVDRYSLVVHDWGVVALLAAQRHPERLERLVVINAVPLLPGYRWHWVARMWRRRGLGEFLNATSSEATTRLLIRQARPRFRAAPAGFVEGFWPLWDRDTRRAVLRLYRSAGPDELAAAGLRLGEITCPALVIWGASDPYLPAGFGRAYAERLPGAELWEVSEAGHWPWIDQPQIIDRVVSFVQV
jgi:Predicted hydrolases or acyltransferases (alpha/beta hydrolase superfamily)